MINFDFHKMPFSELVEVFNNDILLKNDEAYLGDVAAAIAKNGQAGFEFLLDAIKKGADTRRRWAVFGLANGSDQNEKVDLLLTQLITDKCPEVLSEVIDGFIAIQDNTRWKVIDGFRNHKSEYVRGAVLRYACYALKKEEAFKILIEGLHDPHFIVIENAIDELDYLGDPKAIESIKTFVNHENLDVREAALTAVSNLEGH